MTTTYEDAPSMNGHADYEPPRPAKPARKTAPKMHLDPVHGPDLIAELQDHVEALHLEAKEHTGAGQRIILNRAWKIELFVNELIAFHGLDGS
ncbi:MAG: hypothetical protein JWO67_4525 [Streptosporangiaceae bacterium]|nr:hypothetical protein [Streptosporangiaceae bacterium]